ncbi:alpha-ketoacid dehydrogenase subunit alpha/beta [soil metagenome]
MPKENQFTKLAKSLNKKPEDLRTEIIADFKLASESRQASILGRKEVLTGKAKFGIFGDGKEIPQIAMAKAFQNGDFRSGYYRDQTFAFAAGISDIKKFFAQLYADTNIVHEPASGGRSMNGHFANRLLDDNGGWKDLMSMKNTSADISPTASQMQRLVGLAYASKLYRENKELHAYTQFSDKGNEVAFGTIGNASSAEGMFWEALNAAGVLKIPMAVSIWDDGYGISVPHKYQIMKENMFELFKGFEYNEKTNEGFRLYTAKGWDYPSLVKMYSEGIKKVREEHIPAIFYVNEVTQPQGHSTSGSHERYKSKERLSWESEYCCVAKMRSWMIENEIAAEKEIEAIESNAKDLVKSMQLEAWNEYLSPIKSDREDLRKILNKISNKSSSKDALNKIDDQLKRSLDNNRKEIMKAIYDILRIIKDEKIESGNELILLKERFHKENSERYNTYLHSRSEENALNIKEVKAIYKEDSQISDGYQVLNSFFDKIFERDPRVFAIGEDLGFLGDVNQGMAGLQLKYGELRLTDTGIREATIMGQGIGTALRGLKPIIEIQYLDYLLYALQIMSDDLATTQYRTAGGQKSPVIVRTRGHRLEGIWHSGSPMGTIINSIRGIYVCVPRNMTQAGGFYNTLLKSDEPALVIERLNGYRLKEKVPENIEDICIPLGVPEILTEGKDITIVTYGACCDIALEAVNKLNEVDIECELIDVRTLLPFDINGIIADSLKKTNRILFLDEDVPGGASAFMMQQVIDRDGGYRYLDSHPTCLSAQPHRPAYGTDGDYFSKPNPEDIFKVVYEIMNEAEPKKYPVFY